MDGNEKGLTFGRSDILGVIKFIAALLVIVSHAFALSMDSGHDWLWYISGYRLTLGALAVSIFFFASGLLVTKSLFRDPGILSFFCKRIKRVIPPLMFVAVLSAFILGPLVTELKLRRYFTSSETYTYLLNGICILQHDLPGVFERNVYGTTVNGALWTMPVEMVCYVCCYAGYKMRLLNRRFFGFVVLILTAGWCYVSIAGSTLLISVYRACLMYCYGMAAYIYRDILVLKKRYFIISMISLMLGLFTPFLDIIFVVVFPYILIYLCWKNTMRLKAGKLGDYSYGIYLLGFPIQQTVVYLFGGRMNPYINMACALPIAILGGAAIYFIIEKPLKGLVK